MKKKWKGIIALVMVFAMVMSLFVGTSFAADEDEELETSFSYATAEDADGNTVITLSNSNEFESYSYTMTLDDGLTLVSGSASGTVTSSDVEVTVSGSGSITLEYTGTYGDTTEYSETITIGESSSEDDSSDETSDDETTDDETSGDVMDLPDDMGDFDPSEMGDMGGDTGDSGALTVEELVITETEDGLFTFEGQIGYFSSGGTEDYIYTASIIVAGDTCYTNLTGADADSAVDVTIEDSESGHNGIIIIDSGDYTISNATIIMLTDADGSDTCDFSGVGTAIAVYGDSNVTITDSYIETEGVATMPVFCDTGATVTIKNSTLISRGGTLYAEYMNSPDQALMVAPPWILGIMGTSRTTNLMGTDSTMNVIDSDTYSGAWAVLSTDSGSNMYLNIYNTTLTLLNTDESAAAPLQEEGGEISETLDNPYTTNYGSGYGTYVIGAAVETFAGATLNVGTYGSIFTGGSATYTSLTAGETYTLSSATGETDITYTATESKVTVINSDTFGFMIHQDTNTITIEEGTEIYSGYATFLVKSGSSNEQVTATIDDAVIENGGVLIQIMDNDDATNGGMMSTDDELNTNGGSMNFAPVHTEDAGFNTDDATNDGTVQSFTFTNGEYFGNIYNASGSDNSQYGPLDGTTLELTIGEGATLVGAVASTAAIHVTYDGSALVKSNGGYAYDTEEDAAEILAYQNTSFTIDEYFSIGQVANLINYNGANDINVTLTDDAVWYVDGTSVITSLTIEDDAAVAIAEGASLTIGSEVYSEEGYITVDASTGALTFTAGSVEVPVQGYIVVGSFGSEAAAPRYASYIDEDMIGINLTDDVSWHNGAIYMTAGEYTISGSTIIMNTDADGTDTNDFSGLGAAVMAVGSGVVLTVEDTTIETTGVAKLALFTDNGAISIVKRSSLSVNGGVIYDGYYSTADQTMMCSPPWVLGLGGAADEGVNARTTNIMGNYTVGVYIDSDFYAAGWGALSTDSGTNMTMVVINSTVEVENSGYGAYAIGECTEEYYGTTMDVSTYAIIMCGANATFQSYTGGQEVTVYQYSGETDEYGMGANGTAVYTASSTEVAEGETVYSSVVSDNFGFMCHANGTTGYNIVNILDGTSVTSTDAVFLIKKINAIITVDNATLESTEKGVILQIIDNDDDFIGVDMSLTWGFDDDYGHTYGSHMPSFNTTFTEEEGYSNEWIGESAAAALYAAGTYSTEDNWTVDYTMTNTTVTGDIWNSSGYVGSNAATTLNVTLGEGASLTGIISAGAFAHDTKSATVGDGDWSEASALGHVTNIVYSNGVNLVNVTLTDDAVWTVTEDSVIDSITISGSAVVTIASGATLTVGESTYSEGTITASGYTPASTGTTGTSSSSSSESPTTGDSNMMALWVVLGVFAACTLGVLAVRRKRNFN